MKRKKESEQRLTLEQYNATLDDFSAQRAAVNDAYADARRNGNISQCHQLFDLWREIVSEQRAFVLTHPAPV